MQNDPLCVLSSTKRSYKKFFITLAIILAIILVLYYFLYYFVNGTLPEWKTIYSSYDAFYKDAESDLFLDSLPESASEMKYFHQTPWFKCKNGYRAVIGEADYEYTKTNCLQEKINSFNDRISYKWVEGKRVKHTDEEIAYYMNDENPYYMNDPERQEPNVAETLKKYDVDFCHRLAKQDLDNGNYHFIWCWEKDNLSSYVALNCTIYNDETREIIEISYHAYTGQ